MIKKDEAVRDGFITMGKDCVRAVSPSELFNHDDGSGHEGPVYGIVTSVGPARLCLLVGKVGKEYNMILRPLPFEDKISGILGLAESPEGEAALVLDIPGLMEILSIAGEEPSRNGRRGLPFRVS